MVQRGDHSRLTLESLAEALCRHFDGDVATEPWISCAIYLPHAARAEKFQNFVGPETVSNGQAYHARLLRLKRCFCRSHRVRSRARLIVSITATVIRGTKRAHFGCGTLVVVQYIPRTAFPTG